MPASRTLTAAASTLLLFCATASLAGAQEVPVLGPPGPSAPHLDWSRTIYCADGPDGRPVRIQCTTPPAGERFCLVASDRLRGSDRPLSSTQSCEKQERSSRYVQLVKDGYRMLPAIAEAPEGWYRDERGRVFQVSFDLQDRFYLGAAWLPRFDAENGEAPDLQRLRLDVGFSASTLVARRRSRSRHTFRAVEGSLVLDDMSMEGLLFAYDRANTSARPLLRLTTFLGRPRRHDLYMNTGWGLRLLRVDRRPHETAGVTELEFAEWHLGSSIWQSEDLYNRVRLQLGLASGALYGLEDTQHFLAPGALLEARFALDSDGGHVVSAEFGASAPLIVNEPLRGEWRTRLRGMLAYEVVVLAVNDQPVTLRLEAKLDHRDDLGPKARELDASALAGLRFSFWAPPRVREDLPALEP